MGERRVGGGSAPARCSRDATRPPAARRDVSPGRAGPGPSTFASLSFRAQHCFKLHVLNRTQSATRHPDGP